MMHPLHLATTILCIHGSFGSDVREFLDVGTENTFSEDRTLSMSAGGWCGVGDLNAHFGVGSQYKFSCKAGSKKCKVKCSGGGKPNPKKLKCSGGKLKTSYMSGC